MTSESLPLNTLAALAVGLAILACWVRAYKETLAYRFALWWERVPFIGGIAKRRSNATLRAPVAEGSPITRAEHAFVAARLPYLGRGLSRRVFDNFVLYITKADDAGIHPNAAPILASLALLLALPEGWSAGYVMLPWVSADISAAARESGAALLGYFLAAVFYVLAHWAGGLFRKARSAARHVEAWQENSQSGNLAPAEITPGHDQRKDDSAPSYEQFFARARARVWGGAPVVLVLVLVAFGSGITTLRYVGLEEEEIRTARYAQQYDTAGSEGEAPRPVSNPAMLLGHGVALAIFLLSFLATQAIGFLAGATETPNGARTKEAFRALKGLTTFELYEQDREERIAQLEPVYAALQAGLVVRARTTLPTLRDVIAWLEVDRRTNRDSGDDDDEDGPVVPLTRVARAGGAR